MRRKEWTREHFLQLPKGKGDIHFRKSDLIANDWEGKPPKPKCTANGCSIVHAFERLRNGAAFIRRGSGEDEVKVNSCYTNIALKTYDIIANDCEVWG